MALALFSRLLETHFRRGLIPFGTPLDSVAFMVSTPRSGLFQQPVRLESRTVAGHEGPASKISGGNR